MQSLFVAVLLISSLSDNLPNTSCAPIKTNTSCSFMPGCEYDTGQEKCVGKIAKIPRFLKEFRRQINYKFSKNKIFASYDLEAIALHRDSLAQYINENNIDDPSVFNTPEVGARSQQELERSRRGLEEAYGIEPNERRKFPSLPLLYMNEAQLRRIAQENEITMDMILRSSPDVVSSLAFEEERVLSILEALGLKKSDATLLRDNAILNASPEGLKLLISKGKLTKEQILSITDRQSALFWESESLANCLEHKTMSFEWFYGLADSSAIYHAVSNCDKLSKIARQFGMDPNDLPTSYDDLWFLSWANEKTMSSLHKELQLPLSFLIKNQMQRSDIAAIKKSMNQFGLSAQEAVFVLPSWNKYSKDAAEKIAADFETTFLDLARLEPQQVFKPELLKAFEVLRIPPKELIEFELSKLTHPESFKKLYDIWTKSTLVHKLNHHIASEIKNISESPSKMESFEKDFETIKSYGKFGRFLSTYEETVSPIYKSNIVFDRIIVGDLVGLTALPFSTQPELLFDQRRGPALVFAKKLGYEDIASYLEKYTPKTIRITESKGRKTFELPTERDPFISTREAWHLARIKQEPTRFTYIKEVGKLILEQSDFWETSEIKDINLFDVFSVADALENYKGAGYISMSEYIGSAKKLPFPFSKNSDMAKQINASNFAILLAPKSEIPVTVYRGQGCDKKWITSPFRFWSTSASAEFARNWSYGGCVLEVQIPKGFPLFFLNIASMVNAGEHEFLLPSHVLNKKGKLVPAGYQIVNETKKKPFLAAQFDIEHDIEYQLTFEADAYVVKPSDDMMVFDGTDKTFDAYEERYAQLVCSKENLSVAKTFDYLKQMCEFAKKWERVH